MTEVFEQFVNNVISITGRPDLIVDIKLAIRNATLKMHQSDFYPKDIFETGVDLEQSRYIHSFDYTSVAPNMRAVSYFRRVSDSSDQEGTFLTIITPQEILDSYNRNRNDIAYLAGRILEIRSLVSFRYGIFGCYVNPIVTEEKYSSWIAEQFPYLIEHEAARVIFKQTGYDEQAAESNRLVQEGVSLLKLSSIQAVGY